jgi:hypothetical protein
MPTEIIDVTCPSCHKKNPLFKQLTKETYRCDHCQCSHSDPPMSLTSQSQSALKGGKVVGFSVLVSVGLLVFFVRSALGSSQSPLLSLSPVISQPKPLPNPPTIMTKNRSLPSDTALVSQAMGGGSLEVSNGTNRNAYVKLVEPRSGILVGALYVKANSASTLDQIPDGTYQVLFVLGEGWNPNTQSFTKNKSFAKFDQPLNFTTMQLGNRIEYRVFQITLHPVAGGKARTSGVNEQEFNRY